MQASVISQLKTLFPGLISRSAAEAALAGRATGSFLVRLSERVWGYAVTYRAGARCKHYLVEAAPAYRLLPTGHVAHDTLGIHFSAFFLST